MIRLGICISGSGTTAQAIVKAQVKLVGIRLVLVIASRPDVPGVAKMKLLSVPVSIIERKEYKSLEAFGNAMLTVLKNAQVDYVSQNGWLPLTPTNVIVAYKGKIMNQHPGPLDAGRPDFGGKGMYGKRVTCARVAFCWATGKDYTTQSTIHHVTERFDEGPLIRAESLSFQKHKTRMTITQLRRNPGALIDATHDVASRLLPLEHNNMIAVLKYLGDKKRLPAFQRDRPLILADEKSVLMEAKKLAIDLFPEG